MENYSLKQVFEKLIKERPNKITTERFKFYTYEYIEKNQGKIPNLREAIKEAIELFPLVIDEKISEEELILSINPLAKQLLLYIAEKILME